MKIISEKNNHVGLLDTHTKIKKLMDDMQQKTDIKYTANSCKQWRKFMQNCGQAKSCGRQKPKARRSQKPEEARSQEKPEAKSKKPEARGS